MKAIYLLDTNIFSYIAKGSSAAARAQLHRTLGEGKAAVALSAITEAEVRFGMEKYALSRARRSAIEGLVLHFQVLSWGSAEAAAYARLRARLEARGISVATMDLLIAAQAIAAEATLVTRDRIFARMDELPATENWATDL